MPLSLNRLHRVGFQPLVDKAAGRLAGEASHTGWESHHGQISPNIAADILLDCTSSTKKRPKRPGQNKEKILVVKKRNNNRRPIQGELGSGVQTDKFRWSRHLTPREISKSPVLALALAQMKIATKTVGGNEDTM